MLGLVLSTVVFYTLHSLLAWGGVKRWAAQRLYLDRWYRLAYSGLSLLLLACVAGVYSAIPPGMAYITGTWRMAPGWGLVAGGALLAAAAILRFGAAGFVGLAPEPRGDLVRSGLHGRIRHPIYTGVIAMALGWLLLAPTLPTVVVVSITFLYLPIGIRLEERKLIAQFGEAYERYRKEVPALWPKLGR